MASKVSGLKQTVHDSNIAAKESDRVNIDCPEPHGPSCRHGNISTSGGEESLSSSAPQKISAMNHANTKDTQKRTRERSRNHNSSDIAYLRRYLSETELLLSSKSQSTDSGDKMTLPGSHEDSDPLSSISKQAIANAKLRLLSTQGSVREDGCDKCDSLMELLATWQIRAGQLTRNYGRILALLTQTRHSVIALECKFDQPARSSFSKTSSFSMGSTTNEGRAAGSAVTGSSLATTATSPTSASVLREVAARRNPKKRQSMFVNNTSAASLDADVREPDLAEKMYPNREYITSSFPAPTPVPVTSATFAKELKDLNNNLGGAIDLCQQLAAACFKNTYLSKLPSELSNSTQSPLVKKHSTRLATADCNSLCNPSLHAIRELRQKLVERVPSAPSLDTFNGTLTSSHKLSHSDLENDFVKVNAEDAAQQMVESSSHLMHNLSQKSLPELSESSSDGPTRMMIDVAGDEDGKVEEKKEPVPICTYSDSDVKYVMSKISSLEEERYKLLENIDLLHTENATVSYLFIAECL